MIHVFRTSVETNEQVLTFQAALNEKLGNAEWNFDLDDCDHILRVANGDARTATHCTEILHANGFLCEELRD